MQTYSARQEKDKIQLSISEIAFLTVAIGVNYLEAGYGWTPVPAPALRGPWTADAGIIARKPAMSDAYRRVQLSTATASRANPRSKRASNNRTSPIGLLCAVDLESQLAPVLNTDSINQEARADALFAAGRLGEAAVLYRNILQDAPGRLDIQTRVGRLSLLENNPREAIDHLGRAHGAVLGSGVSKDACGSFASMSAYPNPRA